MTLQVAFGNELETVGVVVTDASGSDIGSGSDCASADSDELAVCATTPASAGSAYLVEVLAGAPSCGGTCDDNAYTFSVGYGVLP